ncbi:PGF-pre-PGF domain-containing protein [Candidatus Woesearchaeota archaeon]|nr:PGF-pre-PGF domain-containing protein [Candidatus Woesearchaeota archaeon]
MKPSYSSMRDHSITTAGIIVFISVTLMLVILASASAIAIQYTVCSTGCNFTTITEGLDNISGSANTLLINGSGSYQMAGTTTSPVNASSSSGAIEISAHDVVLDCNNTNITGNSSGYGIYAYASNITIRNCRIDSYASGIFLNDVSGSSSIINDTISSCSYGIRLTNTNSSAIVRNTISSALTRAILFNSAVNNSVISSAITSSAGDVESAGSGTTNRLINTTFDSTKLTFSENANLYVNWFVTAYINDSYGNPVNNTTVNITDTYSSAVSLLTTDADGYTEQVNISQYMINNTGRLYFSNHTFHADNGTSSATAAVNITGSMTVGLTFDVMAASLSINYPQNNSNLGNDTEWVMLNITTDEDAYCRYSNSSESFNFSSEGLLFTTTGGPVHGINYSGLAPNTNYTIYYKCNDSAGNINSPGIMHRFSVNMTPDTSLPIISNISADRTNTTATIIWDTDDMSNSTVYYGTSASALSSSASNSTITSAHSVTLSGLSSNTTYYYNVSSCNAFGYCNTSTTGSFTTLDLTPPVISAVSTAATSIYSARITWTTEEGATSTVRYGTASGIYTATASNSSMLTSHSMNISGLAASTTYYYRVNSTDADGNSIESGEYSFSTLAEPDLTAPTITFSITNMSTVAEWRNILLQVTTNEAATCIVDAQKLGITTSTADLAMASSSSTGYLVHTRYFNASADSVGIDNYFTVKCTDSNMNSGTNVIFFRLYDTTLPTLAFSAPTPQDSGHTSNQTLAVSVTAGEPPYTGYPKIKVDSAAAASMTAGSGLGYTYTSGTQAEGDHTFIVSMRDAKGNEINYTRTYTIDITEPEITVYFPDGKKIKNCNEVTLNVSLDEEGSCEYELFEDLEDDYDDCVTDCDDDYDDCVEDANEEDTTAEKTAAKAICTDDKESCEETCEDDRYDSKKTGSLKLEYGISDCYDNCDDLEDDCKDACSDTRSLCYASASTSEAREDCEDDYDDCKDDCSDDLDDCIDECDDEEEFNLFKSLDTTCFSDGSYMITYSCLDLAFNLVEENVSFEIEDTTPPVILSQEPNGTTIYSSSATLRAYTSEDSLCKFSESDKSYASMEYYFIQTGTAHSFTMNNLNDGDYTYYVRCNDTRGNVMASSGVIRFTIDSTSISSNLAVKSFATIEANTSATFKPDKPEIAITELDIILNENVNNAKFSISKAADRGSVPAPADTPYQYINIEKEGVMNSQIKSIIIQFKVDKAWLSSNSLNSEHIYLSKYTTQWNDIPTTQVSEDSAYYYYEAEVSDLSFFGIMAKKPVEQAADQQAADSTPGQAEKIPVDGDSSNAAAGTGEESKAPDVEEPVEISDKGGSSLLIWILLLCVVVVGGGLAFYFVYMHRHPQQDSSASPQIQPTRDSMAAAGTSPVAAVSSSSEDTGAYGGSLSSEGPDEVAAYIHESLKSGAAPEDVRRILVEAGHDENRIDMLLDQVSADNADNELVNYISASLARGQKPDDVMSTLVDAGHDPANIKALMNPLTEHYERLFSDKELVDYVYKCLSEGLSGKEIEKLLVDAGHPAEDMKMLIDKVKNERWFIQSGRSE